MTPGQRALVRALGDVRFPAGPRGDKRFVRDLGRVACENGTLELSPRQLAFLLRVVHRFRRQLPTALLLIALDEAERLGEIDPDAFIAMKRLRSAVETQLQLPFPAGQAGGGSGAPTPETARKGLA